MRASTLALAVCLVLPAVPAVAGSGPVTSGVGWSLAGAVSNPSAFDGINVSIALPGSVVSSVDAAQGGALTSDVTSKRNPWRVRVARKIVRLAILGGKRHDAPIALAGGLPALLLFGGAVGVASRLRRGDRVAKA